MKYDDFRVCQQFKWEIIGRAYSPDYDAYQ